MRIVNESQCPQTNEKLPHVASSRWNSDCAQSQVCEAKFATNCEPGVLGVGCGAETSASGRSHVATLF